MKRFLFITWAVALTLVVGWNTLVSANNALLIRDIVSAVAGQSDDSQGSDEMAVPESESSSGAVFQIIFVGDSRNDSAQAHQFVSDVADLAVEVMGVPSIGFGVMDLAKHPDYATQLAEQTRGVFSADELAAVHPPYVLLIETNGESVVLRLKMVPQQDGHLNSSAIESIIRAARHPRQA